MKRYKNVYVPIAHRMLKQFKKVGATSVDEIQTILVQQAVSGSSNSKSALSIEYAWNLAGCTTIFVPKEVEDFVLHSKFTISAEAFHVPAKNEVAAFVFESGDTGVLWQSSLLNARSCILALMRKYMGNDKFIVDFDDSTYNDGFAKSDEPAVWLVAGNNMARDEAVLTEIYPTRLLPERLEHPEGLRVMQSSTPFDCAPSRTDAEHMCNLLLRITKVCIYISTFPATLIAGWPDAVQTSQLILPRAKRHGHEVIMPATLKRQVGMHIRVGHFRSLAHERFNRDQNGNIRIIYINPAVVGGKIDPKTVHKT